MSILINNFRGRRPRYGDRLIDDNIATIAQNCDLLSGEVRTWNGLAFEYQLDIGAEVQTIYRYGSYWLQWAEDVDVVKIAAPGNDIGMIAFTGSGKPRIMNETMVDIDGNNVFPESSLSLGLYTPSTAPNAADSGPGAEPKDRNYVYTFVRRWPGGKVDEGPPSPTSNIITNTSGDAVTITGFESVSDTDYGITDVFIYRAKTAGGTSEYQFVGEIPVNTAAFVDTVDDDVLGEALTSTFFDPPPDDMIGLTVMQNGVLVGFRGKEVCFSVPYQAHAWPETYRLPVDSLVVALGVVGANVAVATQGPPYLISGVDPSAMTDINLGGDHPCISKRSLVETKDGVFFATADGLLQINIGAIHMATLDLVTRREWQDYYPEAMHAYFHDGRYFGFYRQASVEGGFIIDFNQNDLTDLPYYPSAGFVDEERDQLYLAFPFGSGVVAPGDCCEGDSISGSGGYITNGRTGDPTPGLPITLEFYVADIGTMRAYAVVVCVITESGNWVTDDWAGHVVFSDLDDPDDLLVPGAWTNAIELETVKIIDNSNEIQWTYGQFPEITTSPPDPDCAPVAVGENQIYAWSLGGDRLLYTWRSKVFHRPDISYAAARVIATPTAPVDEGAVEVALANNQSIIDAGLYGCGDLNGHDMNTYDVNGDCLYDVPSASSFDTLYFKLFGDGELIHTEAVTDDHAFRLPSTVRYHHVEVEVSGNRNVQEIRVGASVEEIT